MFIGVDVGGTNTDAVLMDGTALVGAAKRPTTADVTSGIREALREALRHLPPGQRVGAVMVGTTHLTNALLERKRLASIAVLRLALPATESLPPLVDWPAELRDALGARTFMVRGGHEFDGREISPLDAGGVRDAVERMRSEGVRAVAVSGVFSPVNPQHEIEAAALIRQQAPELRVSLSHENGRMGLLERENAAVLNACLGDVAELSVRSIRDALKSLGLEAPLYISQNDGTLMDAEFAARFPVLTISSGPTNSMRGAAFLSGVRDGIVADVGGTSTDVGALVKGFPREAAVEIEIAGVRTNFRMPDMLSIPLGGGSLVQPEPLRIGPDSAGYRLREAARVFGGDTLTTTDIAVAAGRARVGDLRGVEDLDSPLVNRVMAEIQARVETALDRVQDERARRAGDPRRRRKHPDRRFARGGLGSAAAGARRGRQRHRRRHRPGRRAGGAGLLASGDGQRGGDRRLPRRRRRQGRGRGGRRLERGGGRHRRGPPDLRAQQRDPGPGEGGGKPGAAGGWAPGLILEHRPG